MLQRTLNKYTTITKIDRNVLSLSLCIRVHLHFNNSIFGTNGKNFLYRIIGDCGWSIRKTISYNLTLSNIHRQVDQNLHWVLTSVKAKSSFLNVSLISISLIFFESADLLNGNFIRLAMWWSTTNSSTYRSNHRFHLENEEEEEEKNHRTPKKNSSPRSSCSFSSRSCSIRSDFPSDERWQINNK